VPTRCIKVRLQPGCEAEVAAWAAELNRRSDEVLATLAAEGVTLEAAFLDHQADGVSLIYVMHAADFGHAVAVAKASAAPIDTYHRDFKQRCWDERTVLEPLIDFVNAAAAQD